VRLRRYIDAQGHLRYGDPRLSGVHHAMEETERDDDDPPRTDNGSGERRRHLNPSEAHRTYQLGAERLI
jgi:hypothetical protein